jgi:hypothetical protein
MSTRDVALTACLVAAFATLVTVHVTIVAGLLRRGLPGRALLALVVVPLAPVQAMREGMRARGVAWLAALGAYALSFALASA